LSFNNPAEFDLFRKDCANLKFTLPNTLIEEDPEDIFAEEDAKANPNIKRAHEDEATESVEHADGRVKTNRKSK
jgi:hypothetical protein